MAITCNNPAVTPAGARELSRAITHAWAAGELDDAGVRESFDLALARVHAAAITPADVCPAIADPHAVCICDPEPIR